MLYIQTYLVQSVKKNHCHVEYKSHRKNSFIAILIVKIRKFFKEIMIQGMRYAHKEAGVDALSLENLIDVGSVAADIAR